MKQKLSVSIEENAIEQMDEFVKKGIFRNKSHMVEYALNKIIETTHERD